MTPEEWEELKAFTRVMLGHWTGETADQEEPKADTPRPEETP
jgi:hypothetical protein